MPTVTIVIGLPGSGKSKYLSAAQLSGASIFDDFHANAIDNSHAFENSRNRSLLKRAVAEGKDCFISDIAYCSDAQRHVALNGIASIGRELGTVVNTELIFFANDPSACKANVRRRNRDSLARELAMIDHFTGIYRIPAGTQVLPVWVPQAGSEEE